ncbi:MAG: ATP-binding protein [Paludibacteraceae bacterium]|nr:ATP-binding protein [Paludibacteraceae bacterium]
MDSNFINRTLSNDILEAAQYFSVITLTGPRQSGKSTLFRHLFPQFKQFSMKDLHIREFAQNDPVAFLQQTTDGMFIDEVQMVPQLLEYIQGVVDNNPDRRFLLSGSSNFELMHSISESLAGRAAVFELLPMSIAEVKDIIQNQTPDEVMYNGFYPAVCAKKNIAKLFYPSYVKTYLEKDVRDLLKVKDQMQFLKFIKLCSARTSCLFNASEVGNEVGVSTNTINQWLSILQASYLITLVPPYFENISKRLVKTPKLYFNDIGVAAYLLDIETPKQLERDKMRGALFENMVMLECLKSQLNKGKSGNVYFYRDSNQNEVDVLIKEKGGITALEIKSAMTYTTQFEKHIKQLPSWINTPVLKRAIVYIGDYENTAADIQLINYKSLPEFLG